jgi:hypothetical protein
MMSLTLSKENPATENLLKVAFSFKTDMGVFNFSGEGDLAELCELIPAQVQNARTVYGLMKTLSEEAGQ